MIQKESSNKKKKDESVVRHRELCLDVAEMMVAGHKPSEMAKRMGVSMDKVVEVMQLPATVMEIETIRRDGYMQRRNELADVRDIIASAALESAMICHEAVVLGTVNGMLVPVGLRLRTAQDMLDRAGYGAVEKSVVVTADADSMVEKYERRKKERQEEKMRSAEMKIGQITVVESDRLQ